VMDPRRCRAMSFAPLFPLSEDIVKKRIVRSGESEQGLYRNGRSSQRSAGPKGGLLQSGSGFGISS
jgi:hypothetical protein